MKRFVHDSNTMLRDLPVLDEHGRAQEPVDVVFLKSVFQEFKTAVDAVEFDPESETLMNARLFSRLVSDTLTQAFDLFQVEIPNDRYRRRDHLRVANALVESLRADRLRLRNWADVKVLKYVLFTDMSFAPQVVERYMESGEFFEVLRMMMESFQVLPRGASSTGSHPITSGLLPFRVKLFRLYVFDLMCEREHQAMILSGEISADEEFVPAPLEIRLSFSGFEEGLGNDDFEWDSDCRNNFVSEDDALFLFQAMRGQIDPERGEHWC